ncbi:MAG TPA: hypothetical protein PKX15_01805 [Bacteroidales bacterium]|jgi:hypothetical protein|nr:hypothetical protein [Bacteroidales bacterium]HOS15749.1 hypothetical protein [Bacteroidales bacterium]
MKKYFVLSTVIMVFAIFLNACDKEGIYNPKEKIKAIYEQYEDEKKIQTEEWTWQDNLLTKITYPSLDGVNTVFNYENKRLVKIIEYDEGIEEGYMTFTYDKALLLKVEMFSDDELEMKIDITHDKKKITKMNFTHYFDEYESASHKSIQRSEMLSRMMRFVVGKERAQRIVKIMQRKSNQTYSMEFTYDGDNVVTEKIISDGVTYLTHTYTYDEKLNPFYDALYFAESGALALSKNNVTKETATSTYDEDISTTTYNISYVYDGKFPIEVKTSYTYFDETYSYTTFYEYLK